MVSSYSRPEPRLNLRNRNASRIGLWLATLGVVGAVGGVAWWLVRPRGFEWAAQRGTALLSGATTPSEIESALRRWDEETQASWHARRDELRDFLLKKWSDPITRRLLARAGQVDFGDRKDDWDRFQNTLRKLRKNEQPPVPTMTERVKLVNKWEQPAPVGLTAWFTPILALDGQIYVASMGRTFDQAEDADDGVVRIDGKTGVSEMFFTPDGRGARDIVGLAAGRDCLYVTARNGGVYAIEPGGGRRWSATAGTTLISPPIVVDVNRDNAPDVIVMTAQHRVVALSGASGKQLWQRDVQGKSARAEDEPPVYVTLATGNVWSENDVNIVATLWSGTITVLSAGGEVRWTTTEPVGFMAGAVCVPAPPGAGAEGIPTLYAADRDGHVRAYARSQKVMKPVAEWNADPTGSAAVVANLRTLRTKQPATPPLIISATTSGADNPRGTLSALGPQGAVQWRVPLQGSVWGAPAIADITGDRRPDIVVISSNPGANGESVGIMQIFTNEGHLVLHYLLPAPSAPADSAPLIADVDGDGKLELLWADRRGLLYCFGTGHAGPVEWGSVGGDARNTCNSDNAFSFGQMPTGYQWGWKPD